MPKPKFRITKIIVRLVMQVSQMGNGKEEGSTGSEDPMKLLKDFYRIADML
jgi:hypothetical protein